jgi:glycosyltransferase involved in cell wall biosynthesis
MNKSMRGILVLFHCESNPGFAASSHEHTFLAMALQIVGTYDNVHYGYRTLENGMTPGLPDELQNVIELDTRWDDPVKHNELENYIRKHKIEIFFGFDQPVKRPCYKVMRRAGVKHFVSYWGAPMSSINRWPVLLLKKTQVTFSSYGPDHYVFQSEDMRQTAVRGRGIKLSKTSVVKTGIDTDMYKPDLSNIYYAHDKFSIDRNRKIVVFSGHMEERKGVHIIIKTAVKLCEDLNRKDIHFLILGNRDGQEKAFDSIYKNTAAENFITFGGYRKDIPHIFQSCSVGMIASTGWDSFPMSSIEMASSGLPLVVSDLEGLREAVSIKTGILFPVGDVTASSVALIKLIDNHVLREKMGKEGRRRAINNFSRNQQVKNLVKIVNCVLNNKS